MGGNEQLGGGLRSPTAFLVYNMGSTYSVIILIKQNSSFVALCDERTYSMCPHQKL